MLWECGFKHHTSKIHKWWPNKSHGPKPKPTWSLRDLTNSTSTDLLAHHLLHYPHHLHGPAAPSTRPPQKVLPLPTPIPAPSERTLEEWTLNPGVGHEACGCRWSGVRGRVGGWSSGVRSVSRGFTRWGEGAVLEWRACVPFGMSFEVDAFWEGCLYGLLGEGGWRGKWSDSG